MSGERYDAIVIGGGVNGLVAAAALGKAGRRTLVVERAEQPGGQSRATEFAPGFHAAPLGLDAGWMPPSVSRGLGLQVPQLVHPRAPLTVAADPGRLLSLPLDVAQAAAAIGTFSPTDAERWPAFTELMSSLTGFLGHLYQLPAPDIDTTAPGELFDLARLGWRFRKLGRRNMTELLRTMPMSAAELLDDWFECEALKAAIAAGGLRDIRQGPRSGGTAFVLLHHLVGAPRGAVRGRGYWRSGPGALVEALEALAGQHGVTVRTSADVSRITIDDYHVRGVVLESGEEIGASTVLSGADPARTLLGMVEPQWLDPEFGQAVRNIKFRGATAYVLYGLDHLPPDPAVLEGWLSLTSSMERLERAYDATKYGNVSQRPHVELTAPTLRWPQLAPSGKHVLVARVQFVPYGVVCDELADRVSTAITEFAPGFAGGVRHRVVLTPSDIEQQFGLTEGAASHGELTLDQILFMRPVAGWARYGMPVRGLYLCGAGTHPGPGVEGGAGWLAARRVMADA